MNMRSQHPSLACRSVTKHFGSTVAVRDLSFDVDAGTVAGFVGANGAGKTTTMRLLLGLVAPTSGEATIMGRPYRSLDGPRTVVGAALDGPGAHPAHTARTHLAVVARAAGLRSTRVGEVLDLVELEQHAHRRVGTFSLGMRQRLALATAMLGDPDVLVLDEPANGLDPPGMIWMRTLLRRLADEGRAVLVSSHLLNELAEVVDRMIIIDRGRLVADAPLDELLTSRAPRVEVCCADPSGLVGAVHDRGATADVEAELVTVEGLTAREVGELVSAIGAGPVYQLAERSPRFEDAYFHLAGSLAEPASITTEGGPA